MNEIYQKFATNLIKFYALFLWN